MDYPDHTESINWSWKLECREWFKKVQIGVEQMTQSGNNSPKKFTIRRLDRDNPPPTSPPTPQQPVADDPPPSPPSSSKPQRRPKPSPAPQPAPSTPQTLSKPPSRTRTGAQFRRANGVLAFLGSVFSADLIDGAVVRRSPQRLWWVEMDVSGERICSLIWTAGGRPFAPTGSQWVALSVSGELPTANETPTTLNITDWEIVELAALLAETRLLEGRYRGAPLLDVVVPGMLGRSVLRRAMALGLTVQILPVQQQPLGQPDADPTNALRLRLQSQPEKPIPAALVHSLGNLPCTIVAEPLGLDGSDLLVDVRHRLALPPILVQRMIPTGETWVLGPPDVGHWRLQQDGTEIDGALLLEAPDVEMAPVPAQQSNNRIAPIPVELVSRPGLRQPVDAVLVDDQELDWLRTWLMGRPVGETAFLLPGQGCHFLTAPGGLIGAIPFGKPLTWVGPGALYLELGTEFYPPLPDGARQARFELEQNTVVTVLPERAYRFDVVQMTPVWTLWVGEAPEIRGGLSPQGKQLLSQISKAIRQTEAKPMRLPRQVEMKPVSKSERMDLLERAQRLELAGNLVQAAELLEKAGYPGPAGRLYERAAQR